MADEALQGTPDVTRGVTAQEAQQRLLRALIAEWVHGLIPGRVQRVTTNANGQTIVDVQPGVMDFHRDEEGALVAGAVPIITSVPVVFLTAGGFTFTVPIVAGASGTTGAIIFSERSLDRWLAGDGGVVNPELYSRFNLADAIFIPGLMPFGASGGPNAPTDHATAGSIAGARIHFRDGTITIGDESGSKKIVLDGDGATAKAALATWAGQVEGFINSAVPGTVTPLFAAGPGLPSGLASVVASATQAKAK